MGTPLQFPKSDRGSRRRFWKFVPISLKVFNLKQTPLKLSTGYLGIFWVHEVTFW